MDKRAALAVKEIAFVDPGVSDLGTLLSSRRTGIRAITLDHTGDAVRQIADALSGIDGLRAIHIIAHGAPGEIAFSAGGFTLETVLRHSDDLAQIGAALDADGELLLWSCETGQGPRGDRFVEALCWATGVPVAAASGLVSAPSLGGGWYLDARIGGNCAAPPLTPSGIAAYAGVMALRTWNATTTGNWSSTGSWVGGVVPASGDDVVIGTTTNGTAFTATADLTVSINSLTLAGRSSGSKFTTVAITSGATVTVGAGGISFDVNSIINGTGTLTVNGAISGGGNITASSGTLTLSGTGSIANGGAVLS